MELSNVRSDLFGRPIIFAPARQQRLMDPATPESCPFCPRNELHVGEILWQCGGDPWGTRVVLNRFPNLSLWAEGKAVQSGRNEIVIECACHEQSYHSSDTARFVGLLSAYQARYSALEKEDGMEQIVLIKNNGSAAGASQLHPHTHLQALPFLCPETAMLLHSRTCHICHAMKLAEKHRLVVQSTKHFVALCPNASRFPYETWIVPAAHTSAPAQLPPEIMLELAGLLRDILFRLELVAGVDFAHNLGLLSPPVGMRCKIHWRIGICPRIKLVGGLEAVADTWVNSVYPELAADELRRAY